MYRHIYIQSTILRLMNKINNNNFMTRRKPKNEDWKWWKLMMNHFSQRMYLRNMLSDVGGMFKHVCVWHDPNINSYLNNIIWKVYTQIDHKLLIGTAIVYVFAVFTFTAIRCHRRISYYIFAMNICLLIKVFWCC